MIFMNLEGDIYKEMHKLLNMTCHVGLDKQHQSNISYIRLKNEVQVRKMPQKDIFSEFHHSMTQSKQ